MLTIWSGRRRLHVPSCILAFAISASCVALPVVKVFGEDMKLSDKAIILYGRRCSFGNADDLSCELLRRAAMYSGDASVLSRFLDFYYAVREANWHFAAAFLVSATSPPCSPLSSFSEPCADGFAPLDTDRSSSSSSHTPSRPPSSSSSRTGATSRSSGARPSPRPSPSTWCRTCPTSACSAPAGPRRRESWLGAREGGGGTSRLWYRL